MKNRVIKDFTEQKLIETLLITNDLLLEAAEENYQGFNLDCAFGEVEIKGRNYQMVVSLNCDPKTWLHDGGVRHTEVVKVHGSPKVDVN